MTAFTKTYGTNVYSYEMTSLLILYDKQQGFPCGYLLFKS